MHEEQLQSMTLHGQRNAKAATPKLDVQNKDAVHQWLELKETYVALRGMRVGKSMKAVPKTTHQDVLQLVTLWSGELRKVKPRDKLQKVEHARWKACADKVARLYSGKTPNAEYPDNEEFWLRCTRRLSIYLESRKVVPSKWQILVESVTEAIAEVPETLGRAARTTASAASKVITDPAKLAAVLLGSAILLPPIIRAFRK